MIDTLLSWLHSHSTSVVRDGRETRFIHPTGSTSILVDRGECADETLPLESASLQDFYSKYCAASIGNGHIIIGTPIVGGFPVSHGYRVPDLREMSETARSLGFPDNANIEVFMQQASWMFIYGMLPQDGSLVLFDRDFEKLRPLLGIESLLQQWWEIEQADALE